VDKESYSSLRKSCGWRLAHFQRLSEPSIRTNLEGCNCAASQVCARSWSVWLRNGSLCEHRSQAAWNDHSWTVSMFNGRAGLLAGSFQLQHHRQSADPCKSCPWRIFAVLPLGYRTDATDLDKLCRRDCNAIERVDIGLKCIDLTENDHRARSLLHAEAPITSSLLCGTRISLHASSCACVFSGVGSRVHLVFKSSLASIAFQVDAVRRPTFSTFWPST